MRLQFIAAFAALAAGSAFAAPPMTDPQGRTLVLHGFNTASSAKGSPDGMPWVTKADVDKESSALGFNFVRYLIHWSHIEPQKGVYNETYLDQVAERIGWYKANGAYVMLDFHQDVYGPYFGSNGAPSWATFTDGLPWKNVEPWSLTYLQPGVSRAWDNFWGTASDKGWLQDSYANMVKHVVQRFKDESAVIMIDIMNEPYGGALLWPVFEPAKLKPFYEKVISAVRSVTDRITVGYEPQAFGVNQGIASTLGTPAGNNLAYLPHIYPVLLETGSTYTGFAKWVIGNTISQWKYWRNKESSSVPIIIGEFGLNWHGSGNLDYVNDILDVADQLSGGFTYWSNDGGSWGPRNDDGSFNNLALTLARPYARVIAGKSASWSYNRSGRVLTVSWTADAKISGPTEVFIPAHVYPNGYSVQGSVSAFTQDYSASTRVLKLSGGASGQRYTIQIVPK
ncbi:putative secreted endoglycosylceramidase [Ramicandelaber brevisporus]|nr:putative secreted endoglycosylceramidase [Ramicandelaber brevisporus]